MSPQVRSAVAARAEFRCEYCLLPGQPGSEEFHVEHIVPRVHGGSDAMDNLAYACYHCNAHKSVNLSGIDPESGNVVLLYNPRNNPWANHFRMESGSVHGLSSTGRATVEVLKMNEYPWPDVRNGRIAQAAVPLNR